MGWISFEVISGEQIVRTHSGEDSDSSAVMTARSKNVEKKLDSLDSDMTTCTNRSAGRRSQSSSDQGAVSGRD